MKLHSFTLRGNFSCHGLHNFQVVVVIKLRGEIDPSSLLHSGPRYVQVSLLDFRRPFLDSYRTIRTIQEHCDGAEHVV